MINLKELRIDQIKNSEVITIDTRIKNFRCYLQEQSTDTIKEKLKNIDVDNSSEAIISENDILEFLNNLSDLMNNNYKFDTLTPITISGNSEWWQCKYIIFIRLDQTSFMVTTRYFDPINLSKLNSDNIILPDYGEKN